MAYGFGIGFGFRCRRSRVGPRTRSPWFYGPVKVANVPTLYTEISGLASPRRAGNQNYLWVIEDGTNPHLIALNRTTGAGAGKWSISGATVADVEECDSVLLGGIGYLYLFDTGDNASARATVKVYRIKEPAITGSDGALPGGDVEEIVCQWPAGNVPSHKDVEGAFVDPLTGDVFFLTKRITPVLCYRLPWQASYTGTQTLEYMGPLTADAEFNTLSTTTSGNNGYVTGATIAPNGTEILVRSYDRIARFSRNVATQTAYQAMTGTPVFVPSAPSPAGSGTMALQTNSEPQGEAITFDMEGSGYYTLSEYLPSHGGTASHFPLFRFDRCPTALATWSFQQGTAGYAGTVDTYVDSTTPTTSQATSTSLILDFDYSAYPTTSRTRHGLLKFDLSSISGGRTVVQAYLDLHINTEGLGFQLHKALVDWTAASTYTSLSGGMARDGVDASISPDSIFGPTPVGQGLDNYTGLIHINLPVATLQAWLDAPASNFGWVLVATAESTGDGVQITSSKGLVAALRPKLVVITTP